MSTNSDLIKSILDRNKKMIEDVGVISDTDLPDMSELESLEINEKEMNLSNQRYEKIIKNRVEEV